MRLGGAQPTLRYLRCMVCRVTPSRVPISAQLSPVCRALRTATSSRRDNSRFASATAASSATTPPSSSASCDVFIASAYADTAFTQEAAIAHAARRRRRQCRATSPRRARKGMSHSRRGIDRTDLFASDPEVIRPRIRPFSIHREERWLRSVQAALVAEPTAQGQSSRSRSSGRRTHGSAAHGLTTLRGTGYVAWRLEIASICRVSNGRATCLDRVTQSTGHL